ncbi:hypothetical protein PQR71_07595 [Paraburkholderia fungorum]|uniref:hypothetical protein n=1 Tax=Paraburkholderia fungorum TaxID=134537 RepID=UPI0038BB727D
MKFLSHTYAGTASLFIAVCVTSDAVGQQKANPDKQTEIVDQKKNPDKPHPASHARSSTFDSPQSEHRQKKNPDKPHTD